MNTQTRKPKTGSPDAVRTEVASQLVTRHSTPSGKYQLSSDNYVTMATATLTAQKMATTTPSLPHNQGQTPLTSSTRLSALNMVGDLLRKVGVSLCNLFSKYYCCVINHIKALESRLNTCRTSISKDTSRSHLRNSNQSTADIPQ